MTWKGSCLPATGNHVLLSASAMQMEAELTPELNRLETAARETKDT